MEEQLSHPLPGLDAQRLLVDDITPSDYLVQHAGDRHLFLRRTVVAEVVRMGRLVGCKRYLPTLLVFARRHGRYFGVNRYLTLKWSFGRWLDHLRLHLGKHPAT
jgi:hypothetical protein